MAVIVGIVLGFLSGLGIGGGSLLILWLTLVLGMDPSTARGINLLFFPPAAAVAMCFHRKQGRVQWKTILPAMIAGSLSAAALSLVSLGMDMTVLKKLFGGLLIVTGVRELLYKPKKPL